MDTNNCDVRIYCHYQDLRKIISMVYDYTDGFVEYDFDVRRVDESLIEELNGEVQTFCARYGAISEKYQVITFPTCNIRRVFDLTTALAYITREEPLDAYVFAYADHKKLYVLSL